MEPHCFEFSADMGTVIEVDYTVTGVNPEQINFWASQNGLKFESRLQKRHSAVEIVSKNDDLISLCWEKTDKKSKKLDFNIQRNMAHSDEQADSKTLDSIKDDLELLQGEIEQISANIQR